MSEKRFEVSVKALIFNRDSFLALSKCTWQDGKFELPGGRSNFGETAEETVVREVFEETKLTITPLKLVDTWNFVTETRHVAGIIYLCNVENFENIILSEEHDKYEWLSTNPKSLDKMAECFRQPMFKWDWNALKKG